MPPIRSITKSLINIPKARYMSSDSSRGYSTLDICFIGCVCGLGIFNSYLFNQSLVIRYRLNKEKIAINEERIQLLKEQIEHRDLLESARKKQLR